MVAQNSVPIDHCAWIFNDIPGDMLDRSSLNHGLSQFTNRLFLTLMRVRERKGCF
jgi:hypothetical protein